MDADREDEESSAPEGSTDESSDESEPDGLEDGETQLWKEVKAVQNSTAQILTRLDRMENRQLSNLSPQAAEELEEQEQNLEEAAQDDGADLEGQQVALLQAEPLPAKPPRERIAARGSIW